MPHSFRDRARESDTPEVRKRVAEILGAKIEALRVDWTEAGGPDDLAGIDCYATLPNRKRVGVDVKVNKYGEVRLEYVSRSGEGVVGWTVNDRNQTDYVLNLWPKRYWLIDYPSLKAAAKVMHEKYAEWFGPKEAHSEGNAGATWTTRFVPVPVGRLLFDIYAQSALGTPYSAPRPCPSCNQMHPIGTTCVGGWAPYEA